MQELANRDGPRPWVPHDLANPHLRRPPPVADGRVAPARIPRRTRPDLVLVEGLDDATGLLPDVTRKQTEPPIAILAYTDTLPVRTLVYPLARYSPEYQAICWADDHDVPVEFIDLPSDIFLGLQDREIERLEQEAAERRPQPGGAAGPGRRPRAAAVAVPADRRPGRRARLRHVLGTPLRAQPGAGQLPRGDDGAGPGRARAGRGRTPSGGRRTWCARPTCAAGSRRRSRRDTGRTRSSPWSAPFTARC